MDFDSGLLSTLLTSPRLPPREALSIIANLAVASGQTGILQSRITCRDNLSIALRDQQISSVFSLEKTLFQGIDDPGRDGRQLAEAGVGGGGVEKG